MDPLKFAEGLLAQAGLKINGPNPYDPQVHDLAILNRILAKGTLALGETYVEGRWDCAQLDQFFSRATGANLSEQVPRNLTTLTLAAKARWTNMQSPTRAWDVGRMHYDLPDIVWESTLDSSMAGSCGYYRSKDETLDQAQLNKRHLTLQKIGLKPGHTMLDIGVGWGSFSGLAAQEYGARPTGITVSEGQRDYIARRYGGAVDVHVHPWQETLLRDPVDRIISVEMFEHVGSKNYRRFFEFCRRSMKKDGLMLLQTTVGNSPQDYIEPWMDKYIYPGGCIPTLGQIAAAVDDLFIIEDVHNFGAHYHRTLLAWMDKFKANKKAILALSRKELGMDPEAFFRAWQYHYYSVAGGFHSRKISVQQIVLSPRGVPGGYTSMR